LKLVDSYTRKAVLHRAFLCLVSSDTPARNVILEFVPPAAFRACFLCWFVGNKYEGSRQGMYFAGYNRPAPQHIRGNSEGKEIFAVAAAKRTHEEHMQHGRAVEEGTETVEESGNKGVSCISKFLPYFDVTKGFLIPMAHGCLLGVAKSFLNTVLADYKQESEREDHVITKADRRKMVERQGEVIWTHEHGRPCKCVVKHRGSFTMEELLQFIESSSVYIMRGCLKPELEKAWLHLRRAILHYCKIADDSLDMDKRVGAREDALQYAKIVERVRKRAFWSPLRFARLND
jgi:hypothetical protein